MLALDDKDWNVINDVMLHAYYDDGEGYIELGTDNVLNYDSNDNLLGQYDQTWMALDGHVVSYYYLDEVIEGDEYSSHGYIPALVNGEFCDILVTFDNAYPTGHVTGYRPHYDAETTEAIAKNALLKDGDEITFVCDYYTYENELIDSYPMDTMIVNGDIEITYPAIGDNSYATYRLVDIYGETFETPLIPQ